MWLLRVLNVYRHEEGSSSNGFVVLRIMKSTEDF